MSAVKKYRVLRLLCSSMYFCSCHNLIANMFGTKFATEKRTNICRVFHSRVFHPCSLVPRFPLPRFPPIHFCYSRVFHSRDFSRPYVTTHFDLPSSPHLVADFLQAKSAFTRITAVFRFWAPSGGLGARYGVHVRLIGKRVVDFLLVLIELFVRCYG